MALPTKRSPVAAFLVVGAAAESDEQIRATRAEAVKGSTWICDGGTGTLVRAAGQDAILD